MVRNHLFYSKFYFELEEVTFYLYIKKFQWLFLRPKKVVRIINTFWAYFYILLLYKINTCQSTIDNRQSTKRKGKRFGVDLWNLWSSYYSHSETKNDQKSL